MGNDLDGERYTAADQERFFSLIDRIDEERPKRDDLKALSSVLAERPGLWQLVLPLTQQTEMMLIQRLRLSPAKQEAAKRAVFAFKCDLGFAEASPLERLVIDQVVLTWLRHAAVEREYALQTLQGATPAEMRQWDRLLTGAQRRHLRACEALARVKRMRLPDVLVNVAEAGSQQINIITKGAAEPPPPPAKLLPPPPQLPKR